MNIGVQREIGHGVVVTADAVYRHFVDVPQGGGSIDVNRFDSVRGAAIPECRDPAQATDPQALCSLGPINVHQAPYYFTYKGVLARVEKRLSHGVQVLGSYAFSSNTGTNTGNGFDLENWLDNRGPAASDVTHIVNVSGVVRLPSQFSVGANFSYSSTPPFSAYVGGIDFNGDGTLGDLLPGTTVNLFNRGVGRADLARLVTAFNEVHAGTRDAQDTAIPPVTLPNQYSFGDNFHALDVRVSRSRSDWRPSDDAPHRRGVQRLQRSQSLRLYRRFDKRWLRSANQSRHPGLRLRRHTVVSTCGQGELLRVPTASG